MKSFLAAGFGQVRAYVRSYVLHPDDRAKDLRTAVERPASETLEGALDPFLRASLAQRVGLNRKRRRVELTLE